MSRSLPSRPNLEHLRKQAKDLLDAARTVHPSWQLADAQFALARDYGFPSWPALKAAVDAAAQVDDSAPAVPALGARADEESPMSGTWIANLDESIRHPAFQFRSAMLQVRVAGTQVSMTQLVVDADGQEHGSTMAITADGRPHAHPLAGAKHALVAQWRDTRTLEVRDQQDGADVGHGRYEVAPDGRRLVVSTSDQRLVFDRQ